MRTTSVVTLLVLLSTIITAVSCNSDNHHSKVDKETTQIVSAQCDTMKKESFFSMARKMKADMDSHKEMSSEQMLEMVKVYNTLHMAGVANSEAQENFQIRIKRFFGETILIELYRY